MSATCPTRPALGPRPAGWDDRDGPLPRPLRSRSARARTGEPPRTDRRLGPRCRLRGSCRGGVRESSQPPRSPRAYSPIRRLCKGLRRRRGGSPARRPTGIRASGRQPRDDPGPRQCKRPRPPSGHSRRAGPGDGRPRLLRDRPPGGSEGQGFVGAERGRPRSPRTGARGRPRVHAGRDSRPGRYGWICAGPRAESAGRRTLGAEGRCPSPKKRARRGPVRVRSRPPDRFGSEGRVGGQGPHVPRRRRTAARPPLPRPGDPGRSVRSKRMAPAGRCPRGVEPERRSVAVLRRGVATADVDANAWYGRAELLHKIGRNVDAVYAYDRAVELSPKSLNPNTDRLEALRGLARWDEVVQETSKVIALEPNHSGALYAKAHASLQPNRKNEAVAALDAFLTVEPTSYDGLETQRQLLLGAERWPE